MDVQDSDWPGLGHTENTDPFEALKEELRTALLQLQDSDFDPGPLLRAVAGCESIGSPARVQTMILREIEQLQAPGEMPASAHSQRIYDVLYHRYVQKLTLEETSELLTLSVRHVTRLQRDAIHLLARTLWERGRERAPSGSIPSTPTSALPPDSETTGHASDWRAQMRRELDSLDRTAPGAVADVGQVIAEVIELENALAASAGGVRVEPASVQPQLTAAIHPSALRQMLVTALGQLAPHVASGPITVFSRLEDGNARITLAASVGESEAPTERDLVRYILAPVSASIEARIERDRAYIWLAVPSVGRVTVLVVDDNAGMAHLYRRAAEGTRYRVIHMARGREVLDGLEAISPDLIVLDVMLPDIDGWRLLMHLHESPATRDTPIVVCSVVREEKLALSLGAALYLPKPVRPREFIQALDQVLARA
jgi:CheY-like chemotaxis protein